MAEYYRKKTQTKRSQWCLGPRDLEEALNGELRSKLDDYGASHNLSILMARNGNLVFVCQDRPLILNSGTATLKKRLQLQDEPTRVTDCYPLPDRAVRQLVGSVDRIETDVLYQSGPAFANENLAAILRSANASRNAMINNTSLKELVDSGTIPDEKVAVIQRAKQIYDELKKEADVKEDFAGVYTFKFVPHKTVRDTDTGQYRDVRDEARSVVRVPFTGYPDNKDLNGKRASRKKHLYVYSYESGRGKTYEFAKFAAQHNAQEVGDLNNFSDVRANAQFLIFEEYGKRKKLDFEKLKTATSGDVNGAIGNRKSHGSSYIPRKDVQLLINSNMSIFEVYAKKDRALPGRVFCSKDEIEQIMGRMEVVLLSDTLTLDEEIRRFTHPSDWTEEDYIVELEAAIAEQAQLPADEDNLNGDIELLTFCYNIWRLHNQGKRLTLINFVKDMERRHRETPYMLTRHVHTDGPAELIRALVTPWLTARTGDKLAPIFEQYEKRRKQKAKQDLEEHVEEGGSMAVATLVASYQRAEQHVKPPKRRKIDDGSTGD